MSTVENELDPLQTPLRYVKTLGAARADLLKKLGLSTIEDLLFYLPRTVLDLTKVCPVPQLTAEKLHTVCGTVVDVDSKEISGGRTMTAALLDCDGHFLRGVWFNQPWMLKKLPTHSNVLFSGKPKRRGGRWEINNPKVQWLEEATRSGGGIHPVYRLTDGLSNAQLSHHIQVAIDGFLEFVADPLPKEFRDENELIELRTAVRGVHQPEAMDTYHAARRRLIFDDLLEFQLGLALRRRYWKTDNRAPRLPTTAKIDARIRRLFPFKFTNGQDNAVREIAKDIGRDDAMHRLLQADVGAGKTAVALYAMLVTIAAGHQAVLMAPTEVLANQHWQTVDDALTDSRVSRLCLTGRLTAAQRREALRQIRNGDVQLIVGTQAVIQKDVNFRSLGLAVVDEQHKFGVMQRAAFSSGKVKPHVLVMTATPIPRSLCLTQFGDLDVTVIDELPPGRQNIVTGRVGRPASRVKAWNFIRKQLVSGRQAYVICPRVVAGENVDADGTDDGSAESMFEDLRSGELSDFRVGIVHGQMDRDSKAAAMDAFRDGQTDVLVSTTVVEVGVDVPNATLMVVMQAERFGLSQLHQLRGRIGRGRFQGYCFLFTENETDDASARLTAMEETSDGFKIAEADFELRGPGDVLGTRQSGRLPLRVADLLRDHELLKQARLVAFGLVQSRRLDQPDFVALKIAVLERFGKMMDLPQSG